MIERTLGQVAAMVGGRLSDPSKAAMMIYGTSSDSRTINPGNLYIPLIGEVFDGRIFIKECEDKGAAAFIINEGYEVKKNISIPYIIVEDTGKSLRDLARSYREELDMKIVAITGSNGKTTTKDILAQVLAEKFAVQKTWGNLNNEIGVPKTVLYLNEDTDIGVIELGTDNFGDIALTSDIVKPDIGVILNIGDSHLHNLKSKEGIAKAKMEIIEGMSDDGTFIYNIDDPTLRKIVPSFDLTQKVISFGTADEADFKLEKIESEASGVQFKCDEEVYNVKLLGDHQIYNAGLAVLVSKLMGLSYDEISAGLKKLVSTQNRSELLELEGFDILDDSYKSNPQSLITGLNTTYTLGGYARKIAVLGDMLELGDAEEDLHYDVGEKINPAEIEYAIFYGPLSKKMYEGALENFPASRAFHFDTKADVIEKLKQVITKSSLVFVKGSHGMHMEEIIENIRNIKA